RGRAPIAAAPAGLPLPSLRSGVRARTHEFSAACGLENHSNSAHSYAPAAKQGLRLAQRSHGPGLPAAAQDQGMRKGHPKVLELLDSYSVVAWLNCRTLMA